MPPAKKRRSPLDRFTDATPTAISAGFSAAMNIGPQPKAFSPSASSPSGGVSSALDDSGSNWLQGLQHVSGFAGGSSGDLAGASDEEHDESDGEAPAPKTRKSAPKRKKTADDDAGKGGDHGDEEEATLHRKAQNRIAQREFRQRKQQYIRALEARVELLSSDHDTQVDRLRHALRGLLSENNTLRAMLGSLGRFIGEGMLGGPLQQMGVSRDELLEMINGRSEKTMTDAWQNWPGAKECEALRQIRQDANIPAEGLPDMRNSPGPSSRRGKRKTAANDAASAPSSTANAASTSAQGGRDQDNEASSKQGTPQPQQNETSSNNRTAPNQFNGSSQTQTQAQAPMQQMPPQQNIGPPYGNGGQDPANAQNYAGLLQPNGMMNSSAFGMLAQNGQEDALMASLFGTDSVTSPTSSAFFRAPGEFDSMAPVINGPGTVMPGVQAQQAPHQVTDSPAAVTPTAANTPLSTALFNSAQQFLTSLRHLNSRDDIQRITSISQQLNQLRAAQGRSDFIPILHHDPEACKNAANINLDSADGGSVQSEEEMGRMTDACIQMAYHMSNYRRNASYRLPALLRPTDLQLTRPHDPVIDAIPWPALRDALILYADRINVDDVMFNLVCATKVGEGDVFSQLTWLLDHSFVLKYPFLATPDALDATNRWRKSMNMDPLTPGDVQALSGDGLGGRNAEPQGRIGGLNELRSSIGIGVSSADRNKQQQQQQQQRIPSGPHGMVGAANGPGNGNASGPSTPSRGGFDGQGPEQNEAQQ